MLTAAPASPVQLLPRLERTVALLERRGYALEPRRLAGVCLGGPVSEAEVLGALEGGSRLRLREGLVLDGTAGPVEPIAARARAHAAAAALYLPIALDFVRVLVRACPYLLAVSIAGSLASGGFAPADDVDLNLVVEDGRRHLAYVALNALGVGHALRHRRKPVDVHTRRPLAPRLMTANLVLERSQCFPLARQDEDMAYELLASEPVFGAGFWRRVVAANPALLLHFPQLALKEAPHAIAEPRRLPRSLFPAFLDRPARGAGRAAWRYMMWTRRRRPEALARVAFVRNTMRPYALFDDR